MLLIISALLKSNSNLSQVPEYSIINLLKQRPPSKVLPLTAIKICFIYAFYIHLHIHHVRMYVKIDTNIQYRFVRFVMLPCWQFLWLLHHCALLVSVLYVENSIVGFCFCCCFVRCFCPCYCCCCCCESCCCCCCRLYENSSVIMPRWLRSRAVIVVVVVVALSLSFAAAAAFLFQLCQFGHRRQK